jgi:hypothetical protein
VNYSILIKSSDHYWTNTRLRGIHNTRIKELKRGSEDLHVASTEATATEDKLIALVN